ncbi:hypothetical protein [Actinoplanes teichomyceticus]|uniref:Uncharacterized protein n=1 Tax=Actinoplanes teichomyceticus TaxID=1867 RepID=A0A561VGJ5_ACTTI|nr:hypothetical protein [Actinoplanes teichomyceticus]TWG10729.1 hypothetical protein FHX34_107225 [Actinoplanes teichomyceticus]GIF12647.1 hypothetical protein Ate01nite_26790 [Actinoplanes teichomyceticus]
MLRQAVLVILRDADSDQHVKDLLNITTELAVIALAREALERTWKEAGVAVDLSQTELAQSFRAEGRSEGQLATVAAILRHRDGLAEDQLSDIAEKLVAHNGDEAGFTAAVTPVEELIGLLR